MSAESINESQAERRLRHDSFRKMAAIAGVFVGAAAVLGPQMLILGVASETAAYIYFNFMGET